MADLWNYSTYIHVWGVYSFLMIPRSNPADGVRIPVHPVPEIRKTIFTVYSTL